MSVDLPRAFNRFLSANSAASDFASLNSVSAVPTGARPCPPGFIHLVPFGTGSDNNTFSMRLVGVRKVADSEYLLIPLAQWACTLCADVGEAAKVILNTERFCDTITQTFGPGGNQVVAPGSDVRGYIVADPMDCGHYLLDFDMGTATDANALFANVP
jgi:hypothetical protein